MIKLLLLLLTLSSPLLEAQSSLETGLVLPEGFQGLVPLPPSQGNYRLEVLSGPGLIPEAHVERSLPEGWLAVAGNTRPDGSRQSRIDLTARGETLRVRFPTALRAQATLTWRPLGFATLQSQLQETFSGALAQTTALRARVLSVPPVFSLARTVLDAQGSAWTVLASADRRSVQLWSPNRGSAIGDPLFAPQGWTEMKLTLDAEGRLLLLLEAPAGASNSSLFTWTGSAWAAEAFPAAWTGPFSWTKGPTLWGIAGTATGRSVRLESARWLSPGWGRIRSEAELSTPAYRLAETAQALFLALPGPSGGISRRLTAPNSVWTALGGPQFASLPLLGTLDEALAVLGQGTGNGMQIWSTAGWQTFDLPSRPLRLSNGPGVLLGWTESRDLLQFDGVGWRTPLALSSLTPAPGPWEAEFLPPEPGAKSGTLVLSRATETRRLDLYDLP